MLTRRPIEAWSLLFPFQAHSLALSLSSVQQVSMTISSVWSDAESRQTCSWGVLQLCLCICFEALIRQVCPPLPLTEILRQISALRQRLLQHPSGRPADGGAGSRRLQRPDHWAETAADGHTLSCHRVWWQVGPNLSVVGAVHQWDFLLWSFSEVPLP